jgi:hypothetical protein
MQSKQKGYSPQLAENVVKRCAGGYAYRCSDGGRLHIGPHDCSALVPPGFPRGDVHPPPQVEDFLPTDWIGQMERILQLATSTPVRFWARGIVYV